jgi:hypothetical protein
VGEFFSGQIESNYDEVTDSFDAMNLKSELLRGEALQDPNYRRRRTDMQQVSMLMVSSVHLPSSSGLSCQS